MSESSSRSALSRRMLLASGVRIPNCELVVPVLIDPDTQNGDVTRTVALLKRYARIHEALYGDGQKEKTGFFSQPMNTLAHLNTGGSEELRDSFVYDFGGISQPFRDYLRYNDLSVESQGLVDLLFTPDSLAANLDVGFRGSPNVGSVVLNSVVQSKEMRYLAQSLHEGDRAFFISSIFGGTGAAGFPLLVKNLRDANSPLAHPEVRRRLKAGALVMLVVTNPYVMGQVLGILVLIVLLLAGWEAAVRLLEVPAYFLPTPSAVGGALGAQAKA
mgnify:CR=1 FL=1